MRIDIKRQIMEKFEKNFANSERVCSITDGIFDRRWKIKEDSTYEYVMSLLFSKAFKTYKAINIFCKEGYGQDAGILLRSLFEIYVNIAYISKDEREKRAKRYYEYSYVAKKHLVELVDNYGLEQKGFKGAAKAVQRNRGEIYRFYNAVINNYKNERGEIDEFHWSGKSIRKMAIECGLETDYGVLFWLYSGLVHSSPLVELSYVHVNIEDREIAADIGPSEEDIEGVLPHSNAIFARILENLNSVFNFVKGIKIQEIKNRIGIK